MNKPGFLLSNDTGQQIIYSNTGYYGNARKGHMKREIGRMDDSFHDLLFAELLHSVLGFSGITYFSNRYYVSP